MKVQARGEVQAQETSYLFGDQCTPQAPALQVENYAPQKMMGPN